MDLELRHLRAFVTVAEELNFTRAARRLFIAQQALSTQIRQLEERIGTRLLERTPRKVELTPAGEALLAQARLLLSHASDVLAATRSAAAQHEKLTVGFVAAVTYGGVARILDTFAERRPDVRTLIRFGDLLDPTGGLGKGEVDVVFTYGPFVSEGLEVLTLYSEPRGVALAANHPLARKAELTMQDFVAEPTFRFPTSDPVWGDFWAVSEHRAGMAPKIVAEFRSLDALVQGIRTGLGVHSAVEALVTSVGGSASGIVWRPVAGMTPLEHKLAWRQGDERPAVGELIRIARELFG